MKMQDLINLLSNKLSSLNNAKSNAVVSGNVEAVLRLDVEILETEFTLTSLKSMAG